VQPVVGGIHRQPVEGSDDPGEPEPQRDDPAAGQGCGRPRARTEQERDTERNVNEVVQHAHVKRPEQPIVRVVADEAKQPKEHVDEAAEGSEKLDRGATCQTVCTLDSPTAS
jgi:hypothetical protein